ncbi:MAG TPA: hypothetical protein VLF94_06795, partial [Chlamydiales bacterium]|nr:hypothetical protein [Chlamydiales bacterium]
PDVIKADLYFGVYCIRVLNDACRRFPDFRGYLFLQDDCMINPWNFADLDLDKIWLGVSRYPYAGSNVDPPPPSWYPDYEKSSAYEEFLHASIDGKYREHWGWWVPHLYGIAAVQKAIPNLDEDSLDQLQLNVGKNMVVAQTCDCFYFPQKFRNQVFRLSGVFWDTFYEIAVPTIFCCIDSLENWEFLRMYWGFTQEHFLDYRVDCHWIHPLKFSKKENRDFASEKLLNYYKTLDE